MDNKKILITGAAGNIGYEIIRGLHKIDSPHQIIAGHHDIEKARKTLTGFDKLHYRQLDFTKKETFEGALRGIEVVFLLRPPHLASIPKVFFPFVEAMKKTGVKKIVFLSVQGVENQKFIPHYKLEKLIMESGLEYAFLRPGYFMQNITTNLLHEIKHENKIFIPAGKLKLNWIDARDIGLVGAHILNDFERYKNHPYEITGSEFCGFVEVAKELSLQLGKEIIYESPDLIKFHRAKRKLGVNKNMIFVMIMLHYLPRFSKNTARLTDTVKEITGEDPNTLKEFINREKGRFI